MRVSLLLIGSLLFGGCELTSPKPSATLAHFEVEKHAFHLVVGQQQTFATGTIKLQQQHQSDLDGDGQFERIGIVTLDGGGSGTFYYVALSRWAEDQWQPAGSHFLGDRLQIDAVKLPQYGDVDVGTFYISYWLHRRDQAMADKPKLYLSKQFTMIDGDLVYLDSN